MVYFAPLYYFMPYLMLEMVFRLLGLTRLQTQVVNCTSMVNCTLMGYLYAIIVNVSLVSVVS